MLEVPATRTVLLNASTSEVGRLGGDYSYYRDLVRLSGSSTRYALLPDSRRRRLETLARKLAIRACSRREPVALRRALFLRSRLARVSAAAVHASGAKAVLSHLWFPGLESGLRLPTIWMSQGISPAAYYDYVDAGRWTRADVVWMYRELAPRADALAISTEACARAVLEACPGLEGRVHVIHPPVFTAAEPAPKPSLRDGEVRFLFVGLDPVRKGLSETVEAFETLRGLGSRCTLTVVSRPGPELEERLRALPGVSFLRSGPEVDVRALMAASDVFLMPTHADTYGLAAVEAMAHGCATVVTDLKPLPEVAASGAAGLSVPRRDAGALAAAVRRLVESPALLRGMQAEACAVYRRRSSPEAVGSALAVLVESLLESRRPTEAAR